MVISHYGFGKFVFSIIYFYSLWRIKSCKFACFSQYIPTNLILCIFESTWIGPICNSYTLHSSFFLKIASCNLPQQVMGQLSDFYYPHYRNFACGLRVNAIFFLIFLLQIVGIIKFPLWYI